LFFVFFCSLFFPLRVFFLRDDDGDVDTRTLFDDFLMKEILAGRSDDFLGTTNFLTISLFEDLSGRRTVGRLLGQTPILVVVRRILTNVCL